MATKEVQYEIPMWELSFEAGETLTAHKYKPLYGSAEGKVRLMTAKDLSQKFIGFMSSGDVSGNTTISSGDFVKVMVYGITKVIAGGSFSAFDYLTVVDSQGRLDTAADNEVVIAMALEAASAINHVVSALILHCPIKGDNT